MHKHIQKLQRENAWGECELYPRGDWKAEVVGGDTQLGYWDWVSHSMEADDIPSDSEKETLIASASRSYSATAGMAFGVSLVLIALTYIGKAEPDPLREARAGAITILVIYGLLAWLMSILFRRKYNA